MTTITEALADIKLIKSKIDKKKVFILNNLGRQEGAKDQLLKDGGTEQVLGEYMQSINDLQEMIVKIRSAIHAANASSHVEIRGIKRTIADWIVWRRDVAPIIKDLEHHIVAGIQQIKKDAAKANYKITNNPAEAINPTDIIISLNEKQLSESSEKTQEILDTLDGKLSLHNATIQVEI